MAASKREQILQKIQSVLSAIDVPLYRSPTLAIERTEQNQNAIVIDWIDESAEALTNTYDEVLLQVTISIMSRAISGPETTADDISQTAHALLMADPALGGLSNYIQRIGAIKEQQENDMQAAVIVHRYAITYRHNSNDLTV